MNPDATVIGAGPSGLVAAITLAQSGLRTLVVEQSATVGSRFAGDFQGVENWSDETDGHEFIRSLGVEPDFFLRGDNRITLYGPSQVPVEIRSADPLYYLLRRGSTRGDLDESLLRQALDAGAEIVLGKRLDAIPESGPVILATGPYAADAFARGVVFETSHPDGAFGFLSDHIAPRGYAYLLVHNGRATLATCLFDDFAKAADYLGRTLALVTSLTRIEIRNPTTFGGYINFAVRSGWTRAGGRVLLAGERGGFQDALWGFGLRTAMRSGYLAARAVIEGTDFDELCKKELTPRLEISVANRLLFSQLGNHGYEWVLNRIEANDALSTLRHHFRRSRSKKQLFEIARQRIHPHLREQSCSTEGCRCLWCTHGKADQKDEMDQCVREFSESGN